MRKHGGACERRGEEVGRLGGVEEEMKTGRFEKDKRKRVKRRRCGRETEGSHMKGRQRRRKERTGGG